MSYTADLKAYTTRITDAMARCPFEELGRVAEAFDAARLAGHQIFIAGNGGSSAAASHFSNDLVKGLSMEGHKRYNARALDCVPILTALGNDYAYEVVFSEQLKNYWRDGDLLVVISGSGNSPNVLRAAEWVKEQGGTVISFTGRDGGKVRALSDICCIAPTDCMEEIEDYHMVWIHALVTALRQAMTGGQDGCGCGCGC